MVGRFPCSVNADNRNPPTALVDDALSPVALPDAVAEVTAVATPACVAASVTSTLSVCAVSVSVEVAVLELSAGPDGVESVASEPSLTTAASV